MDETHDNLLTVEAAGHAAGISPRTLRSWIVHGDLPATGGHRGKLVRLADVLALAGTDGRPQTAFADNAPAPPPHPAVQAILEEIRDGVLWPLAERLEALARENGRLAAEHDAAVRERDALAARFESDNRFLDRLVALLQAELDAARRRIVDLEAQLAAATTPALPPTPALPEAPPPEPPLPRGLGRRRIGQGSIGSTA
jgi:hypothetical protein